MQVRPPYISIALVSASALAYEVLLMRLFTIIMWHHFAYMIIALALLGYGISGFVITMVQRPLLPRFRAAYLGCLLLFGVSSVSCFLAAQALPFNSEAILWDARQIGYLAAIFLVLTIPFLFAASAICLAFMQFGEQVSRVYAADLMGAGIGSLGIILVLYFLFPQSALIVISITGMLAAIIASQELQVTRDRGRAFISISLLLMLVVANTPVELEMSPYKSLQQTMRISGTRLVVERSGPMGLLSVVESTRFPLRHAPGLSLNADQEPPPQLAVFTDGDNLTAITGFTGDRRRLAYLDDMTSALPYYLKPINKVLIIGAGGGADVLQAKYHRAGHIDAVELNPQLIDLVNDKFRAFSGALYEQDDVTLHIGEARGYLTESAGQYDLIQLSLIDAFNASSSGLYALNESYLYTIEGLQLYLEHLSDEGYMAITRWVKIPPRDTLKLFATAVEALRASGVEQPGKQLVLIRGWQTGTLLVKKSAFTDRELTALQAFCEARLFDVAYMPGIRKQQVNRYNILEAPLFYLGATALLSRQRETFMDDYKFNLRPASDDRPYFHHFLKWSTLPEMLALRNQGGMALFEWGYIILVATLIIAVMASVLLVITPLVVYRHIYRGSPGNVSRYRVLLYFFAIGLAFLFIEIAFIQKFILFLHHPIYSVAVTLAAFLVFAGLGSYWSRRLAAGNPDFKVVRKAVPGIVVVSLVYVFTLPPLFAVATNLPIAAKVIVSIALVAPLAFFMGMPFPMAITSLARHAPSLIPWAWGVNGCASVISAVLATLLAMHIGFNTVILLALLLYVGAVYVFPVVPKMGDRG